MRRAAIVVAIAGLLLACGDDDGTSAPEGSTTTAAPASTTTTTTTTTVSAPACEPSPTAVSVQERIDVAAGAPRPGWYLRYVPATLAAPPALVVDLHGFVEGAELHALTSDLATLAEREGFVLVTPQGTGTVPFWNYARRRLGPPDFEFVAAVIDEVEATLCTDRRRVFVTGLSNGAFLSSTIACDLADRVAAVAPVAGVRFDPGCDPSRPMPVIAFHGTEDSLVPFDGGSPADDNPLTRLDLGVGEDAAANFAGIVFRPVPEIMADWAAADGCSPEPTDEPVGTDVVHVRWADCDDGAAVELYRVEGGGHSWPGSAFSASIANVIGPTTMTISANELMWSFFEAHPLPE
jgi:polyhydroxybutyrate depolymerase